MPIYFSGQNSRLFQLVSHLSMTLRTSLLFHETARQIGQRLEIKIGRPLQVNELQPQISREMLLDELRRETYALAFSADGSNRVPDIFMRPTVLSIDKSMRKTVTQQASVASSAAGRRSPASSGHENPGRAS